MTPPPMTCEGGGGGGDVPTPMTSGWGGGGEPPPARITGDRIWCTIGYLGLCRVFKGWFRVYLKSIKGWIKVLYM